MPASPAPHHKDLQDLRELPRPQVWSYLQKQGQPKAPRPKPTAPPPPLHPLLTGFLSSKLVKWLFEYLRYRFRPRHAFLDYSTTTADTGVYRLEGDEGEIRIALAGDWASGTDEAAGVAKLITAFDPHYAIHLGDVYYVGDPVEVGENFLGIRNPDNGFDPCRWPGGSRGTFALNGNHEMYALGGYGYFECMLPTLGVTVNGKSQGQRASFFCLENEHWRILALDTGYNSVGFPGLLFRPDCALRPELIVWLRTAVGFDPDDPRGIIVLSHHQYFSRFDDWCPVPAKQLAEFISRPVLWFWGHEHRMAIYEEFGVDGGVTAFGRCIGHGGLPVELPRITARHGGCRVEFVDTRLYPNDENLNVGFNGFARLVLRGNRLDVEYVDVHGTAVFTESWIADPGALRRLTSAIRVPC
jgi:hypothetical protein